MDVWKFEAYLGLKNLLIINKNRALHKIFNSYNQKLMIILKILN